MTMNYSLPVGSPTILVIYVIETQPGAYEFLAFVRRDPMNSVRLAIQLCCPPLTHGEKLFLPLHRASITILLVMYL